MANNKPFANLKENLLKDPDWGPYLKSKSPIPNQPGSAGVMATKLFYVGETDKGQEASKFFAEYSEEQYQRFKVSHPNGYYHLFLAGLYWSLASDPSRAQKCWTGLISGIDQLTDEELLMRKAANQWVMQAYGYAKLAQYDDVKEPAMKGRSAMEQGKGTYKAPHRNSREFALAPLLIQLAEYKTDTDPINKGKVQKALQNYKNENVRYGRLGFPVIFDLQFSYPDIFDPVLPGPDTTKD